MARFQFLKTYDFGENYVTVGPVLVKGYDDDGGIEYEAMEDEGEPTVGADGEATVSKSNNRGMFVTITLKETSNAVFQLDALRKAQTLMGKILPVPYTHIDRLSGDSVVSAYAYITSSIKPDKGRMAGSRQYRIFLPYGKDTMIEGVKNSLPF
jgi:hypothetical protein